jgi:hypothetical protein
MEQEGSVSALQVTATFINSEPAESYQSPLFIFVEDRF